MHQLTRRRSSASRQIVARAAKVVEGSRRRVSIVRTGSAERSRRLASAGGRASAGGARTSGGVGNQARVAAWVASLILANQPPRWLVPDARLIALGGETGLAVDDVGALTDRDGIVVIQAKGGLQLSKLRTSEFARAVDQVVCQFIDGVPAGDRSRPVDDQRDRLVIAGDGRSSRAIKELATVTERLRTLPSTVPLSSVSTNANQDRALATLLSHVRESWTAMSSSDPSDEEIRSLLRVLAVDVLELRDGGTDRATVAAYLRAALMDPKNEALAWTELTRLGHTISEQRAWRRRRDLAAQLDGIGAPIGPDSLHAASVRALRLVSKTNLRSLSEHSRLPIAGAVIRCQRSAVDDLVRRGGSFVITGDPGCGKSGVVYELASRLATTEDVLVLTVDTLPDSAGAAQIELGLDVSLLETLEEWTGAGGATLILDGLDGARGEGTTWLARLCNSLIGTRWRVIATMRRFDLRHNRAWQRVFQANGDQPIAGTLAPELSDVRHYLLTELSDADLAQLASASPAVAKLLRGVSTRMLNLVRNPFNLRLAAELTGAGATVASLAETRDQLHLLQRYWRLRVTDASRGSSRTRALAAITVEMLSSSRLRVDTSVVPDTDVAAYVELLHDGVLHEAASPLIASGTAVLVFSHHILFDFAAAALVFTSTGESRLVALLDENPNLAVIARPSIDLHLADLWHAEQSRTLFSKTVLELTARNHAVAGVGAARVVAEHVRHYADIVWLIKELQEHVESATIFVTWLCGVMDAADHELVVQINDVLPIWAHLAARLVDVVEGQFDPATAQALFQLLFQLDRIDPLSAASAESVVRAASTARLFAISLADSGGRAWLAIRAAQLVPRAVAVDGSRAKELLRVTNDDQVLAALGPEIMLQLVEGIDLIAQGDPDVAAAVLSTVWHWDERRDERTHITQGVLTLTSTRKQDVDHIKWLSGMKFPAFIARVGLLRSAEVLANVTSGQADRSYRAVAREQISAFGADGELLLSAPELDYGAGHGVAAKVVDEFVAALRTGTLTEAEVVQVVKILVSSVVHPGIWRKLLLAAAQSQHLQVPFASVLSSGVLLVNTETRAAAGTLMSALSSRLDGANHAELVEAPIQRAATLFPPDEGKWRDNAIDQLLACLQFEKVQDPDLRSRLKTLLAAGDPPRPPDRAGVEAYWEPLELGDIVGPEIHDLLTETAKDALNELRAALTATQSDTAESATLSDLEHALLRSVETDGLDAEPVQELITRGAERLARERSLPGTRLGELVARILIDAAVGGQPS